MLFRVFIFCAQFKDDWWVEKYSLYQKYIMVGFEGVLIMKVVNSIIKILLRYIRFEFGFFIQLTSWQQLGQGTIVDIIRHVS